MATFSKAIRLDDLTGINVRTATITEASETRHIQTNAVVDADDGTALDVVGESTFEKGIHVYGHDGTVPRSITTDTTGDLQVDLASAIPAGTNNIGDVDIASPLGGGVEATAVRVTIATDSTGVVSVDDNGGALTVDGTVTAAQATAANLNAEVQGDAAADAPVSGNPVQAGGRASTAVPAAMSADGDAVPLWLNRQGLQMVSTAPHLGLFASQPWNLTSKTAQYTTTQTSTVLVAGGVSERIVVTSIQVQAGGTTAGTLQVYFGTGAYARGTNLAIFDGEFAPSATLKPGVVMQGPFISATNGDDILVTTSAAINPLTITVWYYVVT